MKTNDTEANLPSRSNDNAAHVSALKPDAEQMRQLALGKISRRYAAYVVPAALAVLSQRAVAGS